MSHRACQFVLGEKYPRGFLYTRGKINCGRASVYRKYTINKDTGTQTLFIFYKIQILIPMYKSALHSLLLGRSDLGDSGLLSPGASKSSRLITSARLACRSTSD